MLCQEVRLIGTVPKYLDPAQLTFDSRIIILLIIAKLRKDIKYFRVTYPYTYKYASFWKQDPDSDPGKINKKNHNISYRKHYI
jgi:hypothetical protein